MIGIIILVCVAVAAMVFGSVIFFGAPYVPTLRTHRDDIFSLLDMKQGQTLLELGAGDGTVALHALRNGYKVHAIEINPILCALIWLRTLKYRKNIRISWGSFWSSDWRTYDAIYVFLLDKYMQKLDDQIIRTKRPTKLVSFAFRLPHRKPKRELNNLFLYKYQ